MYSIDGFTWSTRRDELQVIKSRHEQELQNLAKVKEETAKPAGEGEEAEGEQDEKTDKDEKEQNSDDDGDGPVSVDLNGDGEDDEDDDPPVAKRGAKAKGAPAKGAALKKPKKPALAKSPKAKKK